ncbi:MAG: hypothetical protein QNK23_01370 [Crocinitomicaceae bacterium]|nr:hypothetical protein [Crocinitomicaceae bacterium]
MKIVLTILIALFIQGVSAQEDTKNRIIILELEESDNRITIESNGYLLTFNQNDLLFHYEGLSTYQSFSDVLSQGDTVSMDAFLDRVGIALECMYQYTGIKYHIKEAIENGQVRIQHRKKILSEIVIQEKPDKRNRFSHFYFIDRAKARKIYTHYIPFVGCPNF